MRKYYNISLDFFISFLSSFKTVYMLSASLFLMFSPKQLTRIVKWQFFSCKNKMSPFFTSLDGLASRPFISTRPNWTKSLAVFLLFIIRDNFKYLSKRIKHHHLNFNTFLFLLVFVLQKTKKCYNYFTRK